MSKHFNKPRVDLFRETIRVANQYHKPNSDSTNTKYDYDQIKAMYNSKHDLYKTKSTMIRVINCDTIDFILDVSRYTDGSILVLNLASDYMPGGGCRSGSMAQEEQLYYCSNYDLILGKFNRDQFYPLDHSTAESILTTNVSIIRDGKYNFLEKPLKTDFLALPALRKPDLVNGKYHPKDYYTMTKKIESIFMLAAAKGYKTLILGAIGCGAYQNPTKIVVEIYNDMILKYKTHFNEISFSVLVTDPKNTNFIEFQKLKK